MSRIWARSRLAAPTRRAALETLVPGDIAGLAPGRMRYTLLLNEAGGILDDLMVDAIAATGLLLVVNAARKEADLAHLRAASRRRRSRSSRDSTARCWRLQGPRAAAVLARLAPGIDADAVS